MLAVYDSCRNQFIQKGRGQETPAPRQNYVGVYGCKAGQKTDAASTLVDSLFQHLADNRSPETDELTIPDCMTYFSGKNNRADKSLEAQDPLLLRWHDPENTFKIEEKQREMRPTTMDEVGNKYTGEWKGDLRDGHGVLDFAGG